jgi:hypothetical protein
MLGKLLGKKTSDSRFPAERITLAEGERDGLPAIAMDYYVGNGEAAERVLAAMAGTSPREFTTKVERDDSWANCAGFFGAL